MQTTPAGGPAPARRGGGFPGAEPPAAAVRELLPPGTGRLLDVACGTGIVTERLGAPGLRVVGVDAAFGMAARAAERLPGSVILGDGCRLPFVSGGFDAASLVWLLHLVPDVEPVIAECARVLRPGGVLLATVDKDAGHDVGSDIDALFAPHLRPRASDESGRVFALGGAHGLRPVAETSFTGRGQGRSPRTVAAALRAGRVGGGAVCGAGGGAGSGAGGPGRGGRAAAGSGRAAGGAAVPAGCAATRVDRGLRAAVCRNRNRTCHPSRVRRRWRQPADV
ncbi:class I SAM-dependent methyltransferase [Streptomyces sp. N35]|uniref:class I SAM-dependent methyltransferase n=1 Tax=Streptomyces sp. N35 TaxID=2795730 RepID=UPI0018F5EAA1|nr:class I SAM-dependent methyltransferase [Streptomyces sp. N35]